MAINRQEFERTMNRLPLGRDPASVRQRVETMEKLLERGFKIPGTNQNFGLDVVLDLIPVVGDVIAAGMGAWIVWEASNLGMSKWQIARMSGNVGVDFLLGAIPWIGAIPDLFFRSNSRNVKIVRKFLDKHHPETAVIEGEVLERRE
ncbi:MAG TPA: DUF4112 domain-containing protein, partial [Allosphingosinicella sp.]|nr:DUF4112 domain-containing protein [Allosphingosinicella sp.]